MHNYLKQKSFAIAFHSFRASKHKIRLNNLAIKKCFSSSIQDRFSLGIDRNKPLNSSCLYEKNNFVYSIDPCFIKSKNQLVKITKKNFYERKSLKWYWREKTYDMLDGDIYKNYLIRYKNNFHMELIPQNLPDGKRYDSCLVWLYDGDFPEYFIEHLLEFNNFPPKNYKIVLYRAPFDPIFYDTAVLQHSWFNIHELPDREGNRNIPKKKIDEHNKAIHREIKDQYNLIGNYKNIFIGGFSQSACMALYSCMTYKENLGGVIMFAGFNFDFTPIDAEKSKIPVLAVNGITDETVIVRHARNSFYGLKKNKFNLNFVEETGLYHAFSKSGLKAANDLLSQKTFN